MYLLPSNIVLERVYSNTLTKSVIGLMEKRGENQNIEKKKVTKERRPKRFLFTFSIKILKFDS